MTTFRALLRRYALLVFAPLLIGLAAGCIQIIKQETPKEEPKKEERKDPARP